MISAILLKISSKLNLSIGQVGRSRFSHQVCGLFKWLIWYPKGGAHSFGVSVVSIITMIVRQKLRFDVSGLHHCYGYEINLSLKAIGTSTTTVGIRNGL